jgi:hypothetical protein
MCRQIGDLYQDLAKVGQMFDLLESNPVGIRRIRLLLERRNESG